MSARNRKESADPLGRYDTPHWPVHRLLDRIGPSLPSGRFLEPACGAGAIIDACLHHPYGPKDWDAFDIEPRGVMEGFAETQTIEAASIQYYKERGCVGVITNTAFHLATLYALKTLEYLPFVALLLRLNWLEGAVRDDPDRGWLIDNTKPDIFVLPNRPRFQRFGRPIGKGTDATAYAWFVWGLAGSGMGHGSYSRLAPTSKRERKGGPP